ncbi:preprotein translocase subunit YajC [Escherichia coli]
MDAVQKGDTVITAGGIIGKVLKVSDPESSNAGWCHQPPHWYS